MSSISELPQIISALQEIDVMIGKLETKTETLRVEAGHAKGELREVEYILYRTLSILNRMGLPPNIQHGINLLQRMIITIRILHSAMALMEMATPGMQILGLLSFAGLGLSTMDFVQEVVT